MKFLIFGGTGFVGRNLSQYIKERGEEVLIISRSGGAGSLAVDITQEQEFSRIDFVPDVVVNCASRIPAKGKGPTNADFLSELFLTNVIGAVNITNWAIQKKVPLIINCSTLVVVRKPWPKPLKEDFFALPEGFHVGYAMSKLSQEQIMDQAVDGTDTHVIHARLSAVYGGGMTPEGIIFSLLKKFIQGEEVRLENGAKNSLDLIHVKDVSIAIFNISQVKNHERIINLARGEEVTILELAETLKNVTGSNSIIRDEETDRPESKADINVDKMKRILGDVYKDFRSLEKGLKEVVGNYKEQSEI